MMDFKNKLGIIHFLHKVFEENGWRQKEKRLGERA
jgi:hypothetical protein